VRPQKAQRFRKTDLCFTNDPRQEAVCPCERKLDSVVFIFSVGMYFFFMIQGIFGSFHSLTVFFSQKLPESHFRYMDIGCFILMSTGITPSALQILIRVCVCW
jgi:hypothetical protein